MPEHVVNFMLEHNAFSASSVLSEISKYFGENGQIYKTEWGTIECKELLKVANQFSSFVSVWEFRFKDKLCFQKYKLRFPEKYQELMGYVQRFNEQYSDIRSHPDVQEIELRNPADDTRDKCRFLDKGT